MSGSDLVDFPREYFAKDLIFVSENDGGDLFDDFEILFGGEGEEWEEWVMFAIADDVISDFGNPIGLIFDEHFE